MRTDRSACADQPPRRINVMQVTDTLDAGGAERVAVNLANLLPRERFTSGLCTTRRDGALMSSLSADVQHLSLGRRARFDVAALRRLATFAKAHDVRVLHAHGTALFVGLVVSMMPPFPAVIWHVHFGGHAEERSPWLYRLAARWTRGIITVNEALAEWARARLRVRPERVWYIPNFSCLPISRGSDPKLPGTPGSRIVCVANLRPEKDHGTLVRAMAIVANAVPSAHLSVVGRLPDPGHADAIRQHVARLGIERHVSILGERQDVADILRESDIGVLSSVAEGFPLALVEYGQAGLVAVATRVGQCAEVLDEGRAGVLVERSNPEALARALIRLLHAQSERRRLGDRLRRRVQEVYGPAPIINRICSVYDTVLGLAQR